MQTAIEAAIIDYAQEAGVDGRSQVINFVDTVSRQVTEATLQGTRTERVERSRDGTIYALVSYPMNSFREETVGAFQKNQDAAFAEFKAEEALRYLDHLLADDPPRAGNIE
jgi:acylphosphatase